MKSLLINTQLNTAQLITPQYTSLLHKRQHSSMPILTYITPWNSNGYQYTVDYIYKFDIISPVWYTMKLSTTQSTNNNKSSRFHAYIDGRLNTDNYYLTELHNKSIEFNHTISITPRILLEFDNAGTILKLIKSNKLQQYVTHKIIALIQQYSYNGIVLECTNVYPITQQLINDKSIGNKLVNKFIVTFSRAIKQYNNKLLFILVVRPTNPNSLYYNYHDFLYTQSSVDYISLMTYDYSASSTTPGGNAPIQWISDSIHNLIGVHNLNNHTITNKLLIGLNYYGYQWNNMNQLQSQQPNAVISDQWIYMINDALNHNDLVTIDWLDDIAEHRVTIQHITDTIHTNIMMIPTVTSIYRRIELCKKYNTGISIWELGQGNTDLISLL